MITALREFTSNALDLMFPPSCVHCGRDGALLCSVCLGDSTALLSNVCRKCAEPLPKAGICSRCAAEKSSLDRLYGSYLYESPVGAAVRAFKFDDVRALGGVLGELFNVEAMSRSDVDLVVPLPLHRSRLRSRGYNQSAILGRRLSARLNVDIREDVLVRSGNSIPQSEQPTAVARGAAMMDAFEMRSGSSSVDVFDKRVLIVDDVFTTGSTLKSAAATLKSAGASWIGGAVLTVQPIGALK